MNHLRRPGPSRAERHGKAATVSRSSGVHEAHDLSDRFGSTWLAAWSRVQLGTLDVAGGQLAGARALPDEALDLSLAIHINRNMALCLVAFARLAFAEGDRGLAAVLAGAAAGLRQRARRRAWPALDQGRPTWWPRSARRRARSGSTRYSPQVPGSASGRLWPPSGAGAAPAPGRPDPRPGLSRSSPTRPP